MKLKILPLVVAVATSIAGMSRAQLLDDNFTADSSLNTSVWTPQSSLLSALAAALSSPGSSYATPTLAFSTVGMQMAGVNGTFQMAGIQSLAAFAPPFTLKTKVMGTQSYGNPFVVLLVNSDLSQWLVIRGDLIPATCYQNIWINYTGSGVPLGNLYSGTPGSNVLYSNPSINVFYTIQISVGTDANASVVLSANGTTLASQSTLSVGNGPFYVVLAQQEGSPCQSGPLAATWQSVSVSSTTPPTNSIGDNFTADSSLITGLWTTNSSLLNALAGGCGSTLLTPTLGFGSAGMEMTGVGGSSQFAGIESLAAFAPPFTMTTTVMGTESYGNAFEVFLVNSNLTQWLDIRGDLIPATCYQNIWINYTGSGVPLCNLYAGTPGSNVLYSNPTTNVFYNIQISVGTDGRASVVLMANGATLASQSNLSVGNGPFYVVLAQQEGLPCQSGPLAATWQSVSVALGTAPPAAPILISPSNGALNVAIPPTLNVQVSDPNRNLLTVTFYGLVQTTKANPDFTIVALPDTQFYTDTNASLHIFTSQTDWILTNRAGLNIAYVTQLGDCVDDGDASLSEWYVATNALYRLENPAPGIPYGVAVGNHDESPNGVPPPAGTTTDYNQYFGTNHFSQYNYRSGGYYGGNYSSNGDNFYDLFSASGFDFIVIYLEYDETMTSTDPRLKWANNLLQAYSNRRAIVVSHYLIDSNSTFSTQGQTIYNALKGNGNLFLMLCGHVNPNGEAQRSDLVNGGTVTTLLSDYQDLPNGGDGWLRIYTFSPATSQIHAKTYSSYLQQYNTSASSQFDIPYNMGRMWVAFATNSNIASGSTTSAAWPGLTPGTQYQWYVTVSDGQATTTGPVWTFSLTTNVPPVFQSVNLASGVISFRWSAISGRTYQLQYKTNLAQISWTSLGASHTATTATMSTTDSIGPDAQRFYRLVMLP